MLIGPASLSILQVAVSGERKTACDVAMGRPLLEWERNAQQEAEEPQRQARKAREKFKAKQKGLLRRLEDAQKRGKAMDVEAGRARAGRAWRPTGRPANPATVL